MQTNFPELKEMNTESSESMSENLLDQYPKQLPLIDPSKKKIRKKKFTYSNPSGEMLSSLKDQRSKGFFKRNFGSLKGGSLRAVVIYWVRMTTGIGVMALPYYIAQLGLLMGSLILILAGTMCYFSFKYIFVAQILTGKKDLVQIARKFIPSWMCSIYSYTLIIDIFSAMMIYTVVSWNILSYLLVIFNLYKEDWVDKSVTDNTVLNDYHKEVLLIRVGFLHLMFFCLIPLFLKRSLEKLKIVSQIFMVSLIFIIVILLCQTPLFYKMYHSSDQPKATVNYFYKPFWNFKTFSYFFSMILAFYVQSLLMSLRKELLVPNITRLKKVAFLSVGSELFLFLILGITCYLIFGNEYTTSLIILRKPLEGYRAFEWVFRAGLVIFFLSNLIGIPMYNVPMRDMIIRKFDQMGRGMLVGRLTTRPGVQVDHQRIKDSLAVQKNEGKQVSAQRPDRGRAADAAADDVEPKIDANHLQQLRRRQNSRAQRVP